MTPFLVLFAARIRRPCITTRRRAGFLRRYYNRGMCVVPNAMQGTRFSHMFSSIVRVSHLACVYWSPFVHSLLANQIARHDGHTASVRCLELFYTGPTRQQASLYSAGVDGCICVWEVKAPSSDASSSVGPSSGSLRASQRARVLSSRLENFFHSPIVAFSSLVCSPSAVLVDKWSTFSAESSVTALKCCASLSILVSGGAD